MSTQTKVYQNNTHIVECGSYDTIDNIYLEIAEREICEALKHEESSDYSARKAFEDCEAHKLVLSDVRLDKILNLVKFKLRAHNYHKSRKAMKEIVEKKEKKAKIDPKLTKKTKKVEKSEEKTISDYLKEGNLDFSTENLENPKNKAEFVSLAIQAIRENLSEYEDNTVVNTIKELNVQSLLRKGSTIQNVLKFVKLSLQKHKSTIKEVQNLKIHEKKIVEHRTTNKTVPKLKNQKREKNYFKSDSKLLKEAKITPKMQKVLSELAQYVENNTVKKFKNKKGTQYIRIPYQDIPENFFKVYRQFALRDMDTGKKIQYKYRWKKIGITMAKNCMFINSSCAPLLRESLN